jgi:hypothetical protein
MDEAVVLVGCAGRDALAMKAREQRGRAGSVKAFVVIEDPNPQVNCSLNQMIYGVIFDNNQNSRSV